MVWGDGLFSGMTLLILAAVIALIWVFHEMTRFKHKVVMILLIVIIVVMYIGAASIFKEKEVDFSSMDGISEASKLYFSWMVSVGKNVKEITANAIKMDWINVDEPVNKTKD